MDWIIITTFCLLFPLSRGQLGSVGQPPVGAQISQAAQLSQVGAQTSQFPQSGAQVSQFAQGGTQLSQGGMQISQYPTSGPQATQYPHSASQGSQLSQGAQQGSQMSQGSLQGAQYPQGAPQGAQYPQGAPQGAQYPQGAPQGAQYPQGAPQGAQFSQGTPQSAPGSSQGAQYPQGTPQGARNPQGAPQGARNPQGAPQGAQYPQGAPQGTQYPQGAPQGARNPQGAPQGAQYPQGAPQGTQYPQGAPQGAQYPQGAPQGTQYPQGAPQGARNPQGAPQGAQYPQGAPQGARNPQGAPQGTQYPQGAPQGARNPQGAPQGARNAQGAPQGAQYPPRPQHPLSWSPDRFMKIESNLAELKLYVQSLQDLVYQERMKYPPPYVENGTTPAVTLSYTSFVNDADMRLTAMKEITKKLLRHMDNCARGPVPPPVPKNIMVQSETVDNSSSIFVSWDPPVVPDDNLHYKVYFSQVDEYGQSSGAEMIFRICDANSTQASVTDLFPRSFYRIRVAASTCLSAESEDTPTVVKTLDIIPSAPLNLRLEGKKANAIAVSWDPPAQQGILINYTIYAMEETLTSPIMEAVDPSVTTYVIYNLYEGSLYTIQVSASTDNGEGPKSQPLNITTYEFRPQAPRNLRAVANNLTSVTLAWDPPPPEHGMIRGYRVNYTTGFEDYQEVLTSGPTVTMVTITNLAPATAYYFQVYARTMKRLGDGSALIMNKTRADVPSKPMSVKYHLSTTGLQEIQLTWQPPENTYGPITKYILHWGVRGGATRKENLTAYVLSWTSDLLDDNTTHDFKLSAVNEMGIGKPTYLSVKTETRPSIIPPNVRVNRRKGYNNSTKLKVTWGTPKENVEGFWILYRKFEWVYTGRWKVIEILDPNARETEIDVKEEKVSYIVVCKGIKRDRNKGNKSSGQFPFPGNRVGQNSQRNPWI